MKKIIICAICAICGFTTANAQGKFGHVNTQEIMQAMPEYAQAESEIKALQSQYEADLKSMQDELQKKGEAFDKEQATLPDNIKQRRQQELQEMYQKIHRVIRTTSRPFKRHPTRRCRLSPLRYSTPSRPLVRLAVLCSSTRLMPVSLISAPLSLPM